MKNFLLVNLLVICISIIISPQTQFWKDVPESQVSKIGERVIIPFSYRVLEFDLNNLKACLRLLLMVSLDGAIKTLYSFIANA